MAYAVQHIDTCFPDHLTDHHNRDGALLLGVFVHGETTFGEVKAALLSEFDDATSSIDPESLPGFDDEAARKVILDYFAPLHPMELDRSHFDGDLAVLDGEDWDNMGETCPQAWFLLTWEGGGS